MEEAHGLAWAIAHQDWPGIEEVVVGFGAVTVVVDPARAEIDEIADRVQRLEPAPRGELSLRTIEIPVVFDGEDLEQVAILTGMSQSGVAAAMAGAELVVAMVGFVPGFGYLVGLPELLASVPRRATPRARVEPGAVALGGGYAGIYPVATPGGWQVVGHTAERLFDRDEPPFAVLRPGDRVRIRSVERIEAQAEAARRSLTVAQGVPSVRVLSPGTLTTVQDRGRIGVAALGVPRAGAADSVSARIANRAVGNGEEAALVEMTLRGATLGFGAARLVALVGDADLAVDGRSLAPGAVHLVASGQVVQVGRIGPAPRAYLAIAGGIESSLVLGSRSSDLLCGLGPGPLVEGDELALGVPGRARGRFGRPESSATLRVLRGPDPTDDDAWARIESGTYLVGTKSDRTGVRLEPERPLPAVAGLPGSVGMVTGAVQLPPDGNLIVLGVDHATLGGYPVVAAVVSADLPRLGRLSPGDTVRLQQVDRSEAARLRLEKDAAVGRYLRGWYPVQAG